MSQQLTYTDPVPVEQPTLRRTWQLGDTEPVDDELAAQWDADEHAPFAGARKKAAREARQAAEVLAQQEAPEAAPAQTSGPAEDVASEATGQEEVSRQ